MGGKWVHIFRATCMTRTRAKPLLEAIEAVPLHQREAQHIAVGCDQLQGEQQAQGPAVHCQPAAACAQGFFIQGLCATAPGDRVVRLGLWGISCWANSSGRAIFHAFTVFCRLTGGIKEDVSRGWR